MFRSGGVCDDAKSFSRRPGARDSSSTASLGTETFSAGVSTYQATS